MEYDRNFIISFKFNITISMCRVGTYSSAMTTNSHLNITINISVIEEIVKFSKPLSSSLAKFVFEMFFVISVQKLDHIVKNCK